MASLHLNLKGEYFDQIKNGTKLEEYRLYNDYWKKRLIDRHYDQIILKRGYPRGDDLEKQCVREWAGFSVKTITHPHFGVDPIKVFAIKVN